MAESNFHGITESKLRRENMKQYDYILVGSGLYNGVFAYFARKTGDGIN